MKVLILAGGLGTRLSEETKLVPKPMVEIGGKPILWHIMKIYSHYGFNDFVVLTGYKSHVIKDYFINYYNRYSDITVDMANNSVEIHRAKIEPWRVTMLYTGENTMTGSRIKKAQEFVGDERFMLTYGDGVADIDIPKLIETHEKSGKYLTLTSVVPEGRFGALDIDETGAIKRFKEKDKDSSNRINGGFMVCESKVFDYIEPNRDDIIFEHGPLEKLAEDNQLNAYKHNGFWHPMDNIKGKNDLTKLWQTDKAPWAIWQKQEG